MGEANFYYFTFLKLKLFRLSDKLWQETEAKMGFGNIWNSHPKKYGQGSRSCRACSNGHGLIRKYGLNMCRQCFHQYVNDIEVGAGMEEGKMDASRLHLDPMDSNTFGLFIRNCRKYFVAFPLSKCFILEMGFVYK